jgi:hypothetical protein
MLTGAPGFADSNLSRMVERGKMKLTTRRRDGKQFGCWLGLRGHGSCRSTSNTDEPIGSVIMSGELCRFPLRNLVRSFDNISEASVPEYGYCRVRVAQGHAYQ